MARAHRCPATSTLQVCRHPRTHTRTAAQPGGRPRAGARVGHTRAAQPPRPSWSRCVEDVPCVPRVASASDEHGVCAGRVGRDPLSFPPGHQGHDVVAACVREGPRSTAAFGVRSWPLRFRRSTTPPIGETTARSEERSSRRRLSSRVGQHGSATVGLGRGLRLNESCCRLLKETVAVLAGELERAGCVLPRSCSIAFCGERLRPSQLRPGGRAQHAIRFLEPACERRVNLGAQCALTSATPAPAYSNWARPGWARLRRSRIARRHFEAKIHGRKALRPRGWPGTHHGRTTPDFVRTVLHRRHCGQVRADTPAFVFARVFAADGSERRVANGIGLFANSEISRVWALVDVAPGG